MGARAGMLGITWWPLVGVQQEEALSCRVLECRGGAGADEHRLALDWNRR